MRLCFLVLAHYNPQGVARLVRTLTADGDRAFVHIDLKVDEAPFRALLPASDLVHYEDRRVDIRWGGSSILAAQVNLMRTALRSAPTADYYWLVSGDTYPLQTVVAAKQLLDAQSPAEYLNVVRMPRDDLAKPMRNITHYRFAFDGRTSRLRLVWLALGRLARRPWRRQLAGMAPHGGSSWFCLTREATQFVVDYLDNRPRFARFVKHSGAPEEWLLQTLLVNEPRFAPRLRGALFWADFRDSTPPPRPPVLRDDHVKLLRQLLHAPDGDFPYPSPPLMVRKIGVDSGPLVDRIESELWPERVTPRPLSDDRRH